MKVLLVEVRKAFGNHWFALSLCMSLLLALLSAFGSILLYQETEKQVIEWWGLVNPLLSASSCFRFFMQSDYIQLATDLFYALLPLIAVMPYGWSLCQEKKTGYLQNIFVRVSRIHYLGSKAIAAALSGGFVVLFSLILNCVVCSCFIPAYAPDIASVFNTGIYEFVMGSELYYNSPILFVCFYLLISFFFAAFWAATTVLAGGFVEDSVRLLAGSFLLLYLFGSFEYKIGIFLFGSGTEYLSTSPLVWLRGVAISGYTDIAVVVLWFLVLYIFVCILLAGQSRKDVL